MNSHLTGQNNTKTLESIIDLQTERTRYVKMEDFEQLPPKITGLLKDFERLQKEVAALRDEITGRKMFAGQISWSFEDD